MQETAHCFCHVLSVLRCLAFDFVHLLERQRISSWCLYFLPTYILISNLPRIYNPCESKAFDLYLDHDQTWFLRWKQLSLLFLPAPWICHTGHKPSSEKWIIDFRGQGHRHSRTTVSLSFLEVGRIQEKSHFPWREPQSTFPLLDLSPHLSFISWAGS